MRRMVIVLLVLISSCANLASGSDKHAAPQDYPLTLHVTRSQFVGDVLNLYVTVDGKTLNLITSATEHRAYFGDGALVTPGDYRARVSHEGLSKRGQLLQRTYEFLWADGTRETFQLAGMSE